MLRRFSIDFAVFSICIDAALITIALGIATSLRPYLSPLPFVAEVFSPYYTPIELYIAFPILWVLLLLFGSVYDGRRNLKIWTEVTSLTLNSALAVGALAGTLYLSYRDLSRVLFLTFVISAYLLLLAWRLVYRSAYRLGVLRAVQPRNVLVVGAGAIGLQLREQIRSYQQLGIRFVGFLDDDPQKRSNNKEVLGLLEDVRHITACQEIQDVIIALPLSAYEKVNLLVADLHDLPVKVWLIPDYFHLALNKAGFEEFAGIPMFDLRAPALNDYQRMLKRVFDLGIIILSLPFALILMGVIAIAIRLDSSGPTFFHQKRIGENGKLFEMLKFRTMIPNAEQLRHLVEQKDEEGNILHKLPNDPRVTRVGRFLRRTSLDELPQIFNVLKGDMSLVGPRPELPYLVEKYESWQRKRFAVPQGVTGWWQVNGRSERPMHLHTEDDLYYVQNYSLLLDLQILFKTVGVVLRGKGAY